MAVVKRSSESEMVNTKTLARYFKISTRRILQLRDEGFLKQAGRSQWDLEKSIHGYIAYRDHLAKKATTSAHTATDARTREIEQRMRLRERELIPIDESMELFEFVTGRFLTALSGIPARITRKKRERDRIDKIIDTVRSRISADFAKAGADTFAVGKADKA